MNHIETSDPPRHPAVLQHLRGPGRKALADAVLSGVALVIFGGLTLRALLVIAAASAIVAAARRYRPKKMIAPQPHPDHPQRTDPGARRVRIRVR